MIAMPEWMRSQFMAPVYALLISLGVALALGAAMNPEGTPDPPREKQPTAPATSLQIRLVTEKIDEQGRRVTVVATGLAVARVSVLPASGERLPVGNGGLLANTPLKVCVLLPDKWKGLDTASGGEPGETCWRFDSKTGPFEFKVEKEN